jgi:hypothetical protein
MKKVFVNPSPPALMFHSEMPIVKRLKKSKAFHGSGNFNWESSGFQNKKERQMKPKTLSWVLATVLLAGSAGWCRADDDNRVISKLGQNSPMDHLRTASFYLVFNGDKSESLPALQSGDNARFYSKVWDGLYLQVNTEVGDQGVTGYMFSFSSDEAGLSPLATNELRDVPTMREVAAMDFRSDDNFSVRVLKPGPGTPDNRGAFRMIHYSGMDMEIRVLGFGIGNTGLKRKPDFNNLSVMVTVREKA